MHHAAIKIRTDAPDHLAIPVKMHNWECSCCTDAEEETPPNFPKPKGKSITMTSCFDANLCHDAISGEAMTGVLHLFNQTPINWNRSLTCV